MTGVNGTRDRLVDLIRDMAPAVAVQVTEAFLERHPDWRVRYGSRAMTAGVQDAGYHLAFLAGALDCGEPQAFANYAGWAARVLEARGIATPFLRENLEQILAALTSRLSAQHSAVLAEYFTAAFTGITSEGRSVRPELALTANVFLQALLTGQRHAAVQIAREAFRDGLTLEQLYVEVFEPALYEIGARWEANRLTVAQEHTATAITQYVMAQVYSPSPSRPLDGTIVLTGVEGEMHNVGAVMVGDILEAGGRHVRFLGTNLPAASIVGTIRETAATHVGISATMLFNVGAVQQLIEAIRSEFGPRIAIIVGGAAFRTSPDLWRRIAADGFASNLRGVHDAFGHRS